MAIINKGKSFANGEQLTADKLNQVIDNATFTTSAVDNVSTQLAGEAIIVKDGGVTTAKLNNSAVTTTKMADANVTTAKIADANVTFAKLTDVIDDDTMATATDTTLATSESIKAYVDSLLSSFIFTESFESVETNIPSAGSPITFSHGLSGIPKIVQVYLRCKSAQYNYSVGDEILIGDYGDNGNMQNVYVNSTTIGFGSMLSISRIKDRNTSAYRDATSPNFVIVIKAYA
jgi:hypothetical protein